MIYNPNGEQLPGVNNQYAALIDRNVCLQFEILDASGSVEYQENVQVTTDSFGMVNLLIGTHTQTSGYAANFSTVNWGADAKFLKVDIDILVKRLHSMRYNFTYENSVIDLISKVGFDEVFGARPIKRAIQNKIEDLISEKILTGEVSEGNEYMLFVKMENDEQIIDIEERTKEEPKKKVSRKKKGE